MWLKDFARLSMTEVGVQRDTIHYLRIFVYLSYTMG